MPTYATAADCESYIEGLTIDDAAAFDRLIERAEKDVDSALGVYTTRDDGLKIAPLELATGDRATLRDATCAQVEYRLSMGEDFFVKAQYAETQGPEFKTKGALPRVGPKTWQELEGSNLLRLTTTVGHGRDAEPPWLGFAVNIGNDVF